MKSLILAACVGSTVAVVVPQFPPPAISYADNGTSTETRPFSFFIETTQTTYAGSNRAIQVGVAPADFVVTDVYLAGTNGNSALMALTFNGAKVAASSSTGDSFGMELHLQHGVEAVAGTAIGVEFFSNPGIYRVTVAGYLRSNARG